MKILYCLLSIVAAALSGFSCANQGVFTNSDLEKNQSPASVSESDNIDNLYEDVNRYTMEDLTDDELQRYNRLMEAHFVAILEDRRNFAIENLIGHRRGPYYTFVVGYRENLGGMRWMGKEEILVWFKGETVVYTDLKPSLLNIKYRRPPDPRPVYQKPSP